jgi:hypothetical protein
MQTEFSIDDILTPLALTVIIDNKVRDPGMSAFVDQAFGLLEMLDFDKEMNQAKIRAWFLHEEPRLSAAIKGKNKNTVVLKALTRFKKDEALVEAMYDAMLAISVSDKEYHSSESDLVKSAASLWGYTRPPFKVVGRK